MPRVSVLIRTRNEARAIRATLEKVLSQTILDREVLVIDSGSTDGTLEIVRRYPVRCYEIPFETFTYGYALNEGFKKAHGTVVACLSAHAFPVSDRWLEILLAAMEEEGVAGVMGRNLPYPDCNPFDRRELLRPERNRPQDVTEKTPFTFSNANCVIRKEIWEKIHFDEHLPYSEDKDWAKKVRVLGYRLKYEPSAAVYHSHNGDLHQVAKEFYLCARAEAEMASHGLRGEGIVKWVGKAIGGTFVDWSYILKNGFSVKWLFLAPVRRLTIASARWKGFRDVQKKSLRVCAPLLGLWEMPTLGGAVFDYYHLKGLSERGIEVHAPVVFHLANHRSHPGWKLYRIPLKRGYKVGPLLVNLFFLIWAIRIWRKTRFQILMVRSPQYVGYFCWFLRRLFNVKTIALYTHLEPENRLQKWFHRKMVHSFSFVTATSHFTKSQLMERYRLPDGKIKVIYPGVPEDIFEGEEKGTDVSLPKEYSLNGRKVLLYVGALTERKNLLFLLDVLEQVRQKYPHVVLILCGERPHPRDAYEIRLKRSAQERGLADAVIFTGKRSASEKRALFKRSDIFVFPSLLEGFGLAVSEAMAMGKAVVCSSKASLPELIEDGVTGLLAKGDDPASFTEQVNRLLGDPGLCQRLGGKARLVAKERFTWTRSSSEYAALFNELLSERKRG